MQLNQVKNTALLLFTRSAEEEALVKDFSGLHSFHTNLLIAENLISHTEKTARKSGLPFFTFGTDLQKGNSFCEKLFNAFQAIFALGFENVIAIGNDCPALTAQDLQHAAQILQNKDAIIGPSNDGGLYLIGLRHNFLKQALFNQIPWESNAVKVAFQSYLHTVGAQYYIADKKVDIDFNADLSLTLLNKLVPFYLTNAIATILAALNLVKREFSTNLLSISSRKYALLRGPPLA